MALSEVCGDTANDLIIAFLNYAGPRYSKNYWSSYFDAAFMLADIAVEIDSAVLPRGSIVHNNRLKSHRIIISDLLLNCNAHGVKDVVLSQLVDIAEINPRLYEAIDDVHRWRYSPEGVAEILRDEWMAIDIDPLYMLLHKQ